MMKESYKKIVNEDLRADARQIGNRILILQGSEDFTTTRAEAEAYLQCFERGSMKIIEGGHFAFVENAVQFNVLAEEFFGNG
jgi:pimeloyl-ACP methyl ester carboxylesterase